MQQLTGINFIFYFGTVFFKSLGTIKNPFLISLITTLVNVCSTPISFYTVERFGRRKLLIIGASGMITMQFIVGIIGVTAGKESNNNDAAVSAMIAFICFNISFFAATWGPCAWVVIGEIFPLPIRSRGVAISTASNWFWNCVSLLPFPSLPFSPPPLTLLPPITDNSNNNTLPRRHRIRRRQPRRQSLLPLGLPLLPLPHLRLLPRPGDERSESGTGG